MITFIYKLKRTAGQQAARFCGRVFSGLFICTHLKRQIFDVLAATLPKRQIFDGLRIS
jgi:hypothetical protein